VHHVGFSLYDYIEMHGQQNLKKSSVSLLGMSSRFLTVLFAILTLIVLCFSVINLFSPFSYMEFIRLNLSKY
jgi:hypothetical protein